MMLKHYKKLFLAFVALLSVFLLASCSQKQSNSQSAAQTEAPKVETLLVNGNPYTSSIHCKKPFSRKE